MTGSLTSDKASKRQIFKVLYFNSRSLINKIELLRSEISVLLPDFICVCETFANDNISDAYLKLVGYEIIVRQDGRDTTNGRTRGLIVYSREGLQACEYNLVGAKTFTECVGISVPWGKGKGQELKLVL